MVYDVAIVGSGISGMTAAVALAKEGMSVIVLEKQDEPGGLMRTYQRRGYSLPTGVHLVGGLGEGETLWRYFKYLGILDRLKPERAEGASALEVRFPELRFSFRGGAEEFLEDLIEAFDGEALVARRFVSDMINTASSFPLYSFNQRRQRAVTIGGRMTLSEYFDELNATPRQRALLSSLHIFHGVPPVECPLPVHFLIMDSFVSSRWRFEQNDVSLAQAFLDALREKGGRVECGAAVSAIETRNRVVTGVRLETGERIECSRVIFTAHPVTLLDMLSGGDLRPVFRERIATLEDTLSAFGVVAISDDPALKPHDGCVVSYDDYDVGRLFRRTSQDASGALSPLFMSFGDLGDERWILKVLLPVHPEPWEHWAHTTSGRRGRDYLETKTEMAERVLAAAAGAMGARLTSMEIVDSFTPLTIRDYTSSPRCSAYGISKSVEMGPAWSFSARTRVKGLYLAGQSILLPGVVGAVISAIKAAGEILGLDSLMASVERAAE